MASSSSSSDPAQLHRVILHLDLDCFYAQVEAKRLGISPEVPLAVQQWQGIIAAGATTHVYARLLTSTHVYARLLTRRVFAPTLRLSRGIDVT